MNAHTLEFKFSASTMTSAQEVAYRAFQNFMLAMSDLSEEELAEIRIVSTEDKGR